jgi:hypothetical protein
MQTKWPAAIIGALMLLALMVGLVGALFSGEGTPDNALVAVRATRPPSSFNDKIASNANATNRLPGNSLNANSNLYEIKASYTSDLSMPTDLLRRIAEVNQEATTRDGDRIIIERVIVTREDVSIIWRLDKSTRPQPSPTRGPLPYYIGYGCCFLKLQVGDKSISFRTVGFPGGSSEAGRREEVTAAKLINKQGEWTISAWYYSTVIRDGYDPPLPGPVFRFTMPPAINSLEPRN